MPMDDCAVCGTRITRTEKREPELIVHLSEDPVTAGHDPVWPEPKKRKTKPKAATPERL